MSDSEDADLAEEEEDFRRFSTRTRSLVQRYSPKAGQAGAFAVGSKRRRSIAEQVHLKSRLFWRAAYWGSSTPVGRP